MRAGRVPVWHSMAQRRPGSLHPKPLTCLVGGDVHGGELR